MVLTVLFRASSMENDVSQSWRTRTRLGPPEVRFLLSHKELLTSLKPEAWFHKVKSPSLRSWTIMDWNLGCLWPLSVSGESSAAAPSVINPLGQHRAADRGRCGRKPYWLVLLALLKHQNASMLILWREAIVLQAQNLEM